MAALGSRNLILAADLPCPLAEIRPATEADLPAITEIYEHAVRYGTATFELIPPDLAEMTRRFGALMDGGFPYFVGIGRRPT